MRKERGEEILRQTDANSCLVCSLLFVSEILTGQRFSKDDEEQLYKNSFALCRESFALSNLLAFIRRFPILDVTIIVDNEPYEEYLKELRGDEKIQIKTRPVTMELIMEEASSGTLIVLVDRYFFDHRIHIAHYVVVKKQENDNFFVIDPWQGKTMSKAPLQLQEAIFGVKHILGWAPMVIRID